MQCMEDVDQKLSTIIHVTHCSTRSHLITSEVVSLILFCAHHIWLGRLGQADDYTDNAPNEKGRQDDSDTLQIPVCKRRQQRGVGWVTMR